LGWLARSKIITIFVLAILILPITNVFAFFNGEAATVVVGQGTFTTGTAGTTATTIKSELLKYNHEFLKLERILLYRSTNNTKRWVG